MSYSDVLSRIQQLQQLVNPSTSSSGPATSADGQDFQTTFASVTGGAGTSPDTSDTGTAAGAYGTTVTGAPVAGTAASTLAAPATTLAAATTATGAPAATFATVAPAAGPAVSGNDVVANSIQYLGVPYKWGGTDPSHGLDCSGLVQQVFANEGVALPRTSAEQATTGTEVAGGLANAQPGDLVFFGSPVHHVGIYAGNGMMVEAPHTGTKVQVHSIDATPSHVRRITMLSMPSVPTTAATTGLLGSQAVPATVGTSGLIATATPTTTPISAATPTTVPAGTTLAALSATDPTAAMDALGVPASLRTIFTTAAQSQNLPVSLLAAVAKVESGFSLTSVSGAGAQGLMQLMPGTAAGIGANPWDATSAVNGAAKLIRGYIDKYNSVPLALAAYNAGTGAVAKYGGIPPYAETQAYVTRVQSLAAAA